MVRVRAQSIERAVAIRIRPSGAVWPTRRGRVQSVVQGRADPESARQLGRCLRVEPTTSTRRLPRGCANCTSATGVRLVMRQPRCTRPLDHRDADLVAPTEHDDLTASSQRSSVAPGTVGSARAANRRSSPESTGPKAAAVRRGPWGPGGSVTECAPQSLPRPVRGRARRSGVRVVGARASRPIRGRRRSRRRRGSCRRAARRPIGTRAGVVAPGPRQNAAMRLVDQGHRRSVASEAGATAPVLFPARAPHERDVGACRVRRRPIGKVTLLDEAHRRGCAGPAGRRHPLVCRSPSTGGSPT